MLYSKRIAKLLIGVMLLSLLVPIASVGAVSSNEDGLHVGKLTIHKFEMEPGETIGEAGNGNAEQAVPADAVKLSGVTFKLTQTHHYHPETDKWSEISGTPFTEVTNSEGMIVLDNITLGRYKVEEIDGPAHVNINEEAYYVDIPMTNEAGTETNYDVHIYPKNETIKGAVQLLKIDGDSEAVLQGVNFSLYDASDNEIGSDLVTDENGVLMIDGLAYGDYYFKEQETIKGYVLENPQVEFSITESGSFIDRVGQGEVVTVTVKNFVEPKVEKSVDERYVNRGEEVAYTLTIEVPGDIATYETFVVTDKLHEHLEFVSENSPDGFTFSENGDVLTWTATPSELEGPGTIEITFKSRVALDAVANEDIPNEGRIDFTNGYDVDGYKETPPVIVTPTAGNISLIKQDGDTKEKLAGAKFELRDGEELIASGVTDETGFLQFVDINYGEYTLHETVAPEGYRKLMNPIAVTVDAEYTNQTIKVDNYQSGWDLPKTGGLGTMLFTLIGVLFIGLALFLYFRQRRHA